jgi:hypothetical protein
LAAAYANIAQKNRRRDLELEATSFYHDSLQKVKHNISDPQIATSDVNMTAVILLGLYEVSAACFDVRKKLTLCHFRELITPRFSTHISSILKG